MHKLDEGYKQRFNKKEMDRMFNTYREHSYKCNCGHTVVIPKYLDKIVCNYCGKYVFRNKRDEFVYRFKEVL